MTYIHLKELGSQSKFGKRNTTHVGLNRHSKSPHDPRAPFDSKSNKQNSDTLQHRDLEEIQKSKDRT